MMIKDKKKKIKLKTSIITEFKTFITRGNVIDLAVGVIIGAAFNKIVSSLVGDIITPVISFFTGFLAGPFDLNSWNYVLRKNAAEDGTDTILNIGSFITNIIDFLIAGFAIFILVKAINKISEATHKMKISNENKEAVEVAATKKVCPFCFKEIDIKAVRCSYCTSILDENATEKP